MEPMARAPPLARAGLARAGPEFIYVLSSALLRPTADGRSIEGARKKRNQEKRASARATLLLSLRDAFLMECVPLLAGGSGRARQAPSPSPTMASTPDGPQAQRLKSGPHQSPHQRGGCLPMPRAYIPAIFMSPIEYGLSNPASVRHRVRQCAKRDGTWAARAPPFATHNSFHAVPWMA